MAYKPVAIMATSPGALSGARCLEHIKVALDSMMARVVLARECIITSVAAKIRDGRLVDQVCLDFAGAVVEELLHEIRLRAMAGAADG
jgi:chromate reductase